MKKKQDDVVLPSGVVCRPSEAGYDWYISKIVNCRGYDKKDENFSVYFCPDCDRCYQSCLGTDGIINYYIDFPTYSVSNIKICELCESDDIGDVENQHNPPLSKELPKTRKPRKYFVDGRERKEILKVYKKVLERGYNKTVSKRLKELMGENKKASLEMDGMKKKEILEIYKEVAETGNEAVIKRLKELMEKRKGKLKLIKGE
tara:strand:+ start:898 stop:1506 length:609 start_codon:yes stop_codon:yes gene_type:complete